MVVYFFNIAFYLFFMSFSFLDVAAAPSVFE